MSLEALIEYGEKDDAWADLYAIYNYLFETGVEHELSALPTWYFERVEGGFVRPSFYLKYVTLTPVPHNSYMTWYQGAVQLQFFSEDVFEAGFVASRVSELLAPPPQRHLILPKYDFTKSPPEKFSISGITSDGGRVESKMGTRILPDSININTFQEEDERWQTVISFTTKSPRLTERECTILRKVTATRIGPPETYPVLIVDVDMDNTVEAEQSE